MSNHAQAAKTYMMCLAAKSAAEAALADAKDNLIDAAENAGTTTVVVSGKAVILTDAIRRSFSIPALREAVSDVIYNATVKHSVDSKSFDRLVDNGSIARPTVEAVVTGTAYVRVNVEDATENVVVVPEADAI
tara:strand:+ start:219 stop:617 length:399 start_codon:yes stop_codon:yes gene_type:complete